MIRAIALLLVAGNSAVAADQSVQTRPSRDVVVTYVVDGDATQLVPGGLPDPVRLSYSAATQRVRAETTGRPQIALIDLQSHTAQAIDTTLRMVLPLPVTARNLQTFTLDGARLIRRGGETIAGLECTLYAIQKPQMPGEVCLTNDGVVLRGNTTIQGRAGTIRAREVRYGQLPATLFEPPPGYMMVGVPGQNGLAGQLGALLGRVPR